MDKYKCWDCEKVIRNLGFTNELKKKCPKDMDGYHLVICIDCYDNYSFPTTHANNPEKKSLC